MTDGISVRMLFFGVYAELASTREGSTQLPAGSTVADLVAELRGPSGFDWLPERARSQVWKGSGKKRRPIFWNRFST